MVDRIYFVSFISQIPIASNLTYIYCCSVLGHCRKWVLRIERELHNVNLHGHRRRTPHFNETQILQAKRSNLCQLNYPTCEAKWDYANPRAP